MDLTRFLRVRKETPVEESRPEEKPSVGTRHYMYKANPLLEKGRSSRAVTKELNRKEKRHNQLVSRRGISPSNIDSEDEEDVSDDKSKVTKKSTTIQREPLVERPVRSNAAAERMKRLLEYQQKRKQQQAEDTKKKRPPFKVGTYKLDSKTTPLKAGGFNLNASKIGPQNSSTANRSLFKFTATSSKHTLPATSILERKAPVRSAPLTAKPGYKPLKSTFTKGSAKEQPMDSIPLENLSQERILEKSHISHENFQCSNAGSASPNTNLKVECVEEMDIECQTAEEASKQTEVSTTPATHSNVDEDSNKINEVEKQVTPVHKKISFPESTSEIASFKTPGLTTPISRIRGRSIQRTRQLESSLLKEVLRPDICSERGSSTDRKRRQLGRPISRTPAEILGLEDLFDAIDSGSPMSILLQKSKSLPEEEEMIVNTMPKKLDAVFAEITSTSESVDQSSEEEPKRDVRFFRTALKKETDFLENQCIKWNAKIDENSMSEDTLGQIRTAVGLARLGMDRKGRFKQFEGLIDDCEFQRGERKTTCQDLQGFWDMISVQIEDAKIKFLDLEKLEANGWVLPQQEKKVAKKRATIPINRPKAPAAKSGIRAMIEARRKAMAGKSESPAEKNENVAPSVPDNLVETKFNGSFMGFNTPHKLDDLAKRKSLLHSGCTSKTSSPQTNNLRGVTPNTPSSVKIGKPANKRLSELIMLSTRHLRKSDYFGDVEQSPVKTTGAQDAEEDMKKSEGVISVVQKETPTTGNKDGHKKVELCTTMESNPEKEETTATPKSANRRGRKSNVEKPILSEFSASSESQNSDPELPSRALRSRKSIATQGLDIDKVKKEEDHALKTTKEEETTDPNPTIKSTDSVANASSGKDVDLMDVDQTPSRRTRKSVVFKISEDSTSIVKEGLNKRRKSLATETTTVVDKPLLTPSKSSSRSRDVAELLSDVTPTQNKRGRKSIAPEQKSEVVSFTPKRTKNVTHNSPLRVTFEQAEISDPEALDTPNEKKPKRGRPSHVFPALENQATLGTPSRSRRSIRASMISDLISFESPDARHAAIVKPQPGVPEPAPQRVTRKSVALGNFQLNFLD